MPDVMLSVYADFSMRGVSSVRLSECTCEMASHRRDIEFMEL